MDEFAQQQRLFDGGKGAPLGAGEHADERLGEITGPALDQRGVTTQPAQGGNAPIAIDEHQAFAAGLGHRNAGDHLAAALDRAGEALHRVRLEQPRAGKAQFQAVQVHLEARGGERVHAGETSPRAAGCL